MYFSSSFMEGNIQQLTGQSQSSLLRIAKDKPQWATTPAETSVGVLQQRLSVK